MSLLFPRLSAFGPVRSEYGPFFNLFNDTFNELQKISETARVTFAPKFDVKEAKDEYILEGELPGINQKDITIEFADEQTLTIRGRTESFKEEGTRPTEAPEVTEAGKQKAESKEVAAKGPAEVAKQEPRHTYWVSERSVGEFSRSFAFPSRVDQEHVKASLKNGILSVTVPKLQKAAASKRITIE